MKEHHDKVDILELLYISFKQRTNGGSQQRAEPVCLHANNAFNNKQASIDITYSATQQTEQKTN